MSHPTQALKLSAGYAVEKHRGSTRGKEASDPRDPSVREPHMLHDVDHWFVRYGIKCLGKIKVEEDDLSARTLAMMKLLIRPSKTILYGPAFYESILLAMD